MSRFRALELQSTPQVLLAVIPGAWLLDHSTPSWRIEDPQRGFQRMVNERRARLIADTVLAQGRSFPNAIVLATNSPMVDLNESMIELPDDSRFLVVDGQHRLWAQQFTEVQADYACVIHLGLEEREMAELFLEINDNQKRVPSSLRWDLVRLVEPDVDVAERRAVDLIYELATEKSSPLFQRIDLTGEQSQIGLKQGSLAPELKKLVERKNSPLSEETFELQHEVLLNFFTALQEADPDGWRAGDTPFYQARVLRAILQLLPRLIEKLGGVPSEITALDFLELIGRIDTQLLATDKIRERQGNAGIAAIRKTIEDMVFAT